MIIISNRYSYALKNFGFAQGDIGRSMFEFADIRSSLRAAIGYDNQEAIDTVVRQHEENITDFHESFAKVENTIVSDEGRATYDEIESELDEYWELDAKIMDLGATTDRAKCVEAQELALSKSWERWPKETIRLVHRLPSGIREISRSCMSLCGDCGIR